jgi:branched-chain amino acid transport system permease protein
VGNWELVIGFLLVFIMLAGEKGIWGSLEPLLKKLIFRERAAVTPASDAGAKSR